MTAIPATPKKRNHPLRKSRIELAAEFSALPMDAMATSSQLAAYLGVSESTLERARWAGGSIPYIKFGRSVRYLKSVALENIQTRVSTTQVAV